MTEERGAVEAPVEHKLGMAPERDEVLRQLDDRTNQTWAGKRARWAAFVLAQDAEIQRLRERLAKAAAAFEREQARADAADVRAETAKAAERERCAKLCEAIHARHIAEHGDYIGETYAAECARAIRA